MAEKQAASLDASNGASPPTTTPITQTKGPRGALDVVRLIWDFTESNFDTFVIPNTSFGVLGALAGAALIEGPAVPVFDIVQRLPLVVLFNWYSVLIFDLANQRSPESIQEDIENKPWRPLPSGKVTAEQTRRAMLIAIPTVLACNYGLGVWKEGVFILILTWLYNDLGGGDELARDLIIAVAYGLFNLASLRIAVGPNTMISVLGGQWIAIVSGIILTTMQVQDLKDQAGDRYRRRKTIPLVLGDGPSRWMIASCMPVWSLVCSFYWQLQPWGYAVPMTMGIIVAFRAVQKREPREDARTWRYWCLWTAFLYFLPVLHRMDLIMGGDRLVV